MHGHKQNRHVQACLTSHTLLHLAESESESEEEEEGGGKMRSRILARVITTSSFSSAVAGEVRGV